MRNGVRIALLSYLTQENFRPLGKVSKHGLGLIYLMLICFTIPCTNEIDAVLLTPLAF